MKRFGLLGKTLSHSFSKKYFSEKFNKQGLNDHIFELFELPLIKDFPALIKSKPDLCGMNVTIPYKQQVMKYLDGLDASATKVGAVNVIKFEKDGRKTGYNSDYFGFKQSLINYSKEVNFNLNGAKALILGTGGAAKAVIAALNDLNIPFKIVSREKGKADLTYEELFKLPEFDFQLIINSSPLGTFPKTEENPEIPYNLLTSKNLLFDLVYNPEETLFMKKGKAQGANVKNGLEMLHLQAEKAWEIWNT
jgi:shikimate dehydrogenase